MQEGTEEGNDNSDPPPPPPFSHSMKFTRKKGEEEEIRPITHEADAPPPFACRLPHACLRTTNEGTNARLIPPTRK